MKSKAPDTSLRITMQYRSKATMVYELECEGATLDVHVSQRKSPADSGDWCVEARNGHAASAVTIMRWGSTPVEALQEVGRAWQSTGPALGLCHFDWKAVEQALNAIHAM